MNDFLSLFSSIPFKISKLWSGEIYNNEQVNRKWLSHTQITETMNVWKALKQKQRKFDGDSSEELFLLIIATKQNLYFLSIALCQFSYVHVVVGVWNMALSRIKLE